MTQPEERVCLGNEAIARGIVESGCHVMAAYPGTPSSEILPAVARFKKEHGLDLYVEWSTNEKVALENALVATYTGKRACVAMKQVGLSVASDPLMSAAYIGTVGGLVIVSCDDPGPHSSQTEQDSRFLAMFAKIPVFDPSSPREAKAMVPLAFELSERFQIPVLLRPVMRVSHAQQTVSFNPILPVERRARFQRNPRRWAATPRFRLLLHRELNRKVKEIEAAFEAMEAVNFVENSRDSARLGIIAAGIGYAMARDLLPELGLEKEVPILKIGTPYPLPAAPVEAFLRTCDHVLVLEETEPVIEIQIRDKTKIRGRLNGAVPSEGEMTPEVVSRIVSALAVELGIPFRKPLSTDAIEAKVAGLGLPDRRPSLCSGCAHRASFFGLKQAFPDGLFPSDIGCYTLGMNMDTVDTVHDMGAAITFASGLYHAYEQDGGRPPIIATIGDSTFYHSGPAGLTNAVYNGARFVLVILDNAITAMTGMQPTPESGLTADGHPGRALSIEDLVRGCGVRYLRVVNPYDLQEFIREARKARRHTLAPDGGMAVLISRYPCITHQKGQLKVHPLRVTIRHVPPPEKNLSPVTRATMPQSLLPAYLEKTAPCTSACPLQVDARGYLRLIVEGRYEEALARVREKNPFPGITGRLCAKPCEKACRRKDLDEPLAIDLLKRFLADRETVPPPDPAPAPARPESIAIVGTGPAGLMAAYDLRRLGHPVTLFDALPIAGGTLAVGTGRFRLPEGVLTREVDVVKRLGAQFRLGLRIGETVTLEDLRAREFRAILLAPGAHHPVETPLPGADAEGVIDCLGYLRKAALLEPLPSSARVAVLGLSERALDGARTAVRLGAKEVTVLFSRTREEAPVDPGQVRDAEEEGIVFRFQAAPVRIACSGGKAEGVVFRESVLSEPLSAGTKRTSSLKGPGRKLKADLVITVPEYVPDLDGLGEGVPKTGRGTIEVNPATLATPVEGLFAAGEAVTGQANFIEALAGGRKAALSIHRYLVGEGLTAGKDQEGKAVEPFSVCLDRVDPLPRVEEPKREDGPRTKGFEEVRLLPSEKALAEEAGRCLHCGSCTGCDLCLLQCPEGAISKTETGYTVDYGKCTGCRVCARECPTSALEMPDVGACMACGFCLRRFECPSLLRSKNGRVVINRMTCVDCGLCAQVCNQGGIVPAGEKPERAGH
jgi:indolepyruvate ferredoxin oxidoreductase, alpha subunit